MLETIVTKILKTRLPVEYILGLHTLGIGLPESATKHLLGIENEKNRQQFTGMIKRFADIYLNVLPLEPYPDCGIDDIHHVQWKAGTKPISIPLY